jgi:hypothetical protein
MTGAIALFVVTLCVAPDVIDIVGADGLVTVIVVGVVATRFAPSLAINVMVAVPIWPISGVTETMQALVPFPHVAGVSVTPGVPVAPSDAGMRDGLLLVTEKLSVPKPFAVIEAGGVLLPPTTVLSDHAESPGPGYTLSAPRASTRP